MSRAPFLSTSSAASAESQIVVSPFHSMPSFSLISSTALKDRKSKQFRATTLSHSPHWTAKFSSLHFLDGMSGGWVESRAKVNTSQPLLRPSFLRPSFLRSHRSHLDPLPSARRTQRAVFVISYKDFGSCQGVLISGDAENSVRSRSCPRAMVQNNYSIQFSEVQCGPQSFAASHTILKTQKIFSMPSRIIISPMLSLSTNIFWSLATEKNV